ncbi:MAG: beta-lactamase [Pseudonocardia sp.]|nr:beta-lactamase [Pseudonocardia sp.]
MRVALSWPADHVAAAVVGAAGDSLGAVGEQDRRFPIASVTKLLTAYAVNIAVEEGALEWDQPAGPPGSTVRHLIAHASGLDFDSRKRLAEPGTRRIYSNAGFEVLADAVAAATDIPFGDYLAEAVLQPLGMSNTSLDGSPAADATASCADLARFAAELQAPRLLSPSGLAAATAVAFPGLNGVVPGFGGQKPNDWGLGFELRGEKNPHWTGRLNSPATFGHFGQSGTFLWVDPEAGVACVALTDRDFGPWAKQVWPPWSDGVLAELRGRLPR